MDSHQMVWNAIDAIGKSTGLTPLGWRKLPVWIQPPSTDPRGSMPAVGSTGRTQRQFRRLSTLLPRQDPNSHVWSRQAPTLSTSHKVKRPNRGAV